MIPPSFGIHSCSVLGSASTSSTPTGSRIVRPCYPASTSTTTTGPGTVEHSRRARLALDAG
ncbi:uncharacterized protein BO80DRAFT_424271 [Aspergillus ibericus CBS 121593]|uniref:Uncharacterized protein n=1 Tax=Aspergillus ibericus CBS 121593 TaxID=1448316 RepID=A0A395H2A1_9EURO|nr:hypothetical protein BO80DRAFT_424271 [Aspergillus ibericus CBS 121593]RAL01896.1 hypothetical protein BO80DRAFT_424271 [Aspergillus ibericus CBS 121593]